jgi:small ligand-binding sensory domain FIST
VIDLFCCVYTALVVENSIECFAKEVVKEVQEREDASAVAKDVVNAI